jgi:hypothetical protein
MTSGAMDDHQYSFLISSCDEEESITRWICYISQWKACSTVVFRWLVDHPPLHFQISCLLIVRSKYEVDDFQRWCNGYNKGNKHSHTGHQNSRRRSTQGFLLILQLFVPGGRCVDITQNMIAFVKAGNDDDGCRDHPSRGRLCMHYGSTLEDVREFHHIFLGSTYQQWLSARTSP